MKILKPCNREKHRYLLIKGKDANFINFEKAIFDFIGVLGYSKTNPQQIKTGKNQLIVSINKSMVNEIRASLIIFNKDLKIIKVSGSLKKIKN